MTAEGGRQGRASLILQLLAKDEASAKIKQAGKAADEVNQRSVAAVKSIDEVSRQTFGRIAADVQMASKDFKAGVIGIEQYNTALRFARQEAMSFKATGVQPLGSEMAAFNTVMRQTGGVARSGSQGLGSLRSAMGSLAFTAAGLPGRLGEVSSILSQFAIGSLTTVGVFAGLAAIAMAFKKIREDANAAKEKVQEFIDLDPLGRRGKAADYQGLAAATIRRDELQAQLDAPRGAGRGGGLLGLNVQSLPMQESKRKKLQAEIDELNQSINDFLDASVDEFRAQQERLEREAEAERKRAAGEAERAAREAETAERRHMQSLMDRLGGQGQFGVGIQMGLRGIFDKERPKAGALNGDLFANVGRGVAPTARESFDTRFTAMTIAWETSVSEMREKIDEKMKKAFSDVATNVKRQGQQLVGALAMAANSLAGMVTGRMSGLGGLGGILAGFAGLPGLSAATATTLGMTSIGFSFLDALTSSDGKNAMTEAHLAALRQHEDEKPTANVFVINQGGFDPHDRGFQRLVDDARREAQEAGYSPNVRPGS